jgi:heavy metal sensor kinase
MAMGITLLVVGVAIEQVAYNRISASIDNSLRQSAFTVLNEISLGRNGAHPRELDSMSTVLNPPPWPPRYVQILSRSGEVLNRSRNLGEYPLPIDTNAIRFHRLSMTISPDVRLHGGEPIRMVTFPLPDIRGERMGWGQVALSLHELDRARKKNQLALTIILPGAIAISALAGWWLARRALKPIDGVIRTAQRIRAENLNERLPNRDVDDELGRLISTLNELLERLETNFRQINRFSADVSHELRTPLTIIQGEAEVALREGATREGMQLALEVALDEAQRMSKLVKNLLMLARLETGQHRPQFVDTPLGPIVEDVTEEALALARAKEITFQVGNADDAIVWGDTILLHQLVFNLIENAVKYTPRGGQIELSLVANGTSARVAVKDTGVGISDLELGRIFDRFYRGDTARNHTEGGSGLGLALVKQITEAHKGTIQVTSKTGEGSTFTVILPLKSQNEPGRGRTGLAMAGEGKLS